MGRYNSEVMPLSFRLTPNRVWPDRVVLAGLLVAAAAYCRDIRYDFILDDVSLILMNETITSWRNWNTVFRTHIFFTPHSNLPTAFSALHYRPVYMLWLMLNESLFGLVLPWWHISSLLLHLAVTCLVYQLGVRLLKDRWTAALAALLFAFHPVHVESVSYVTASTDLLVALFVVTAFLAYSRFRENDGSPGYLVVALLAATLAMLSKETAVMLPWILVAYEALRETAPEAPRGWPHGWKRFVWTLPFFAIVGAYLAVRTMLFGPNMGPGPGGNRLAVLIDIPLVLIAYLRTLVWPFPLSFFYPVEWGTQWTLLKGAGIALVVVAATLLWEKYRDRPAVRLQLAWMAILFVPAGLGVFTFVREDWLHDRHMYLVSVPFCLIAAVLLTDLSLMAGALIDRALADRALIDRRLGARSAPIAGALVLAILLLDTATQVPRFKDSLTIFASALQVAPNNLLVRSDYAQALWGFGHQEESLREFRTATEMSPKSARLHDFYAGELAQSGRDDEALEEYAKALRWTESPTPFRAYLLYEMAGIEVKHSQSEQAADHMREALQIVPQTMNYHALLAHALAQEGRTQQANDELRMEASIREQFLHDVSTK
jgi:tetratricopeptide (TPR) repeat protein